MKWIAIGLWMLAFPGHTQQVHKCVDAGHRVSYQSAPCEPGQHTLKQWQAPPDPVVAPVRATPPPGPPAVHTPRTRPRPGAPRKGPVGASIAAENRGNSSACVSAKQQRRKALDRAGFKRTYAMLQKLDDAVWRACN